MITCPACGAVNDDDALFCRNLVCRTYLAWDAPAPVQDPGSPTIPQDARARTAPAPTAPVPEVRPTGTPAVEADETSLFVEVQGEDVKAQARQIGVGVSTEPEAIEAEPGVAASLQYRVHNGGTIVDSVTLSLEGMPAGWGTIDPPEVTLYPGETVIGTVTFVPPRSPTTPAGRSPVTLRAVSGEDQSVSATDEVTIKVLPFYEMATEEVAPRESRARRAAQHVVKVRNVGNTSIEPTVRVVDTNETLRTAVDGDQTPISPGATRSFTVEV
nr:hypothetical protein [Actinomycetota bacterium]